MLSRIGSQLLGSVRTQARDTTRCMAYSRAMRKLERLGARSQPMRLDLGAGGPGRSGTIGIDLHPNADVTWDLTRGIPIPANRVGAIFSDHFFEHLPLVEVVKVLTECHRVLIDGGRLRITVPHIDPYIDAWLKGDSVCIASKITDVPEGEADLYAMPFDRISWLLLRNGEHKSLFDRESILHKVRLAGFDNVRIDSFNPKVDKNHRFSSVYVEAVK